MAYQLAALAAGTVTYLTIDWNFIKQMILHPQQTGSVIPSSQFLAKEIAKHAGDECLMIGIGVGSILQYLNNPDCVEINPEFIRIVQPMFPNCLIHETDVLSFNPTHKYQTVISTIPHKMFKTEQLHNLLNKYLELASEKIIFYEYMLPSQTRKIINEFFHEYKYELIPIWLNVPPAYVRIVYVA